MTTYYHSKFLGEERESESENIGTLKELSEDSELPVNAIKEKIIWTLECNWNKDFFLIRQFY